MSVNKIINSDPYRINNRATIKTPLSSYSSLVGGTDSTSGAVNPRKNNSFKHLPIILSGTENGSIFEEDMGPVECPSVVPELIYIDGWQRLFLGNVKTWASAQCVESSNIYVKATGPGALEIFDGILHWNPAPFGELCGWTQSSDAGSPNFGYVWIEVDDPFNASNQYIWRCSWWVRLLQGPPDVWEMRIDIANNAGQFLNSAYLYKTTGATPAGAFTFSEGDSSLGITNPESCYQFAPTTITITV